MEKVSHDQLKDHLQKLQKKIVAKFETLEPVTKFECNTWPYQHKGGGRMSLIRGDVFEKAAVHFSAVSGPSLPFNENSGDFFATGLSLITHMKNPHAPTVHMNIRYIETKEKFWFGGGYDLSPMGFVYDEDTAHFHSVAKSALKPFGEDIYLSFKQNAKEYFYIKHRKKERGVGGIFFDYYNSGNLKNDLNLWETVGDSFLEAIMPIYQKRVNMPYTEHEREIQLKARAHYAEFNLVYDRGTKFGLESNGNIDAILSSLPPLASW